jgi:hypothetical protein
VERVAWEKACDEIIKNKMAKILNNKCFEALKKATPHLFKIFATIFIMQKLIIFLAHRQF